MDKKNRYMSLDQIEEGSGNKPVIIRTWSISRITAGIVLIIIGICLFFQWKYWILMDFPRYFLDDLNYWFILGLNFGSGILLIVTDLKRKKP